MPGVGTATAPTIEAESGDIPRCPEADPLGALAGGDPPLHESGQTAGQAKMRHRGKHQLGALSPVANKLRRVIDAGLKGPRPDEPHDHGPATRGSIGMHRACLQRDFSQLTELGESALAMGTIRRLVPSRPVTHEVQYPLAVKCPLGQDREQQHLHLGQGQARRFC
jgi:hypothetical protein